MVNEKKPNVPFEIKSKAARDERTERISKLTKDILGFLEKNKIDARDAKPALRAAIEFVNQKTRLDK